MNASVRDRHLGFYTVAQGNTRKRYYVQQGTSVEDLNRLAKEHVVRLTETMHANSLQERFPATIPIYSYTVTTATGSTATALTVGTLAAAIGTVAIFAAIAGLFYAFSTGSKVTVTAPTAGEGGGRRQLTAREWRMSAVRKHSNRQVLAAGLDFEADCIDGDCEGVADDNHDIDDDISHQVYDLMTSGQDDGSGNPVENDGSDTFNVNWQDSEGSATAQLHATAWD